MTTRQLTPADLPPDFIGSVPEFLVLQELLRIGKQEGLDFSFQSPLLGGRLDKGGVVIDFLFADPPNLAINVQGTYYHYGLGVTQLVRDQMGRAQLAALGITLIFVDEDDIYKDVEYYVKEALQYRDHSRLGR